MSKLIANFIFILAVGAYIYVLFQQRALGILAFNATFIVSFLFLFLAFLVQLIAFRYFLGKETLKDKIFHLPILYIAYGYLIIQSLAALFILQNNIVLPEGTFPLFPFPIVLVFYLVILCVALFDLFAVGLGISYVQEVDEQISENQAFFKEMTEKLLLAQANVADAKISKEIEKLAENSRFSDPQSVKESKAIEEEILERLDKLRFDSADELVAFAKIGELNRLLEIRNQLVKTNK